MRKLDTPPKQLKNPGPLFFYKYQSIDQYPLKNLENDQLWISRIKHFNDPFEFKFHIIDSRVPDKEQKELMEFFMDSAVICLAAHPELTKNWQQDDSGYYPDNMLMWAHYANNHKGFCLGLRKRCIMTRVHYIDDFPKLDLEEKKLKLQFQLISAMLTKQTCWNYENEYRTLNTEYKDMGMPCSEFGEVERIYFGLRAEDEDIDRVRDIVKGRDITFYKAKLKTNKFQIEFYQI